MAFIGWLIKRMVPDAASSVDGAGKHTKQMSIEAVQLQAMHIQKSEKGL